MPRFVLRDFVEEDRDAFITYQCDPRYCALYDLEPSDLERPSSLFDLFLGWRDESPRRRFQLGVFSPAGVLLGSGGVRVEEQETGVLGIELSPEHWGRYALALDVSMALVDLAFGVMGLDRVVGRTSSGNDRIAKLARWFGAHLAAEREGPGWMAARREREVDWILERSGWVPDKRIGRRSHTSPRKAT